MKRALLPILSHLLLITVPGLVNAPEVMALSAQARLRLERVRERLGVQEDRHSN
ncbi:MAG: hypothetical protein WCH04_09035 [Gammaproteobacteria bacterium]